MKLIDLNAAQAQELCQKKSITIESSTGGLLKLNDIVAIREPWAALKDPATGEPTGRYHYAARKTAEPINFEHAPPENMPIDAMRLYAKVVDLATIIRNIAGGDTSTAHKITFALISKEAAELEGL